MQELLKMCLLGSTVLLIQEKVCVYTNVFGNLMFGSVNGGWGEWTSWSTCADDCRKTRSRLCDNPTPVLLGKDCVGYNNQSESCSGGYCRGEGIIFSTDMNQLSLLHS